MQLEVTIQPGNQAILPLHLQRDSGKAAFQDSDWPAAEEEWPNPACVTTRRCLSRGIYTVTKRSKLHTIVRTATSTHSAGLKITRWPLSGSTYYASPCHEQL